MPQGGVGEARGYKKKGGRGFPTRRRGAEYVGQKFDHMEFAMTPDWKDVHRSTVVTLSQGEASH